MRIPLFLIAVNISIIKSNAQVVFCPPGAEWRYTRHFTPFIYTSNEKVFYSHDSIFNNETVKVLKHDRFFALNDCSKAPDRLSLIRQAGDTIFMLNTYTSGKWRILYNFNAKAGQSWITTVYGHASYPITYTVDVLKIDTININGFDLRRMQVTFYKSTALTSDGATGFITERFGSVPVFIFDNIKCYSENNYIMDFLCYQDNQFGLMQVSEKPCDFSNFVGIEEYSVTKQDIRIFPNPSSDHVTIEMGAVHHVISDYRIEDMTGRTVLSAGIEPGTSSVKIDVNHLNKGIYLVKVVSGNKLLVGKLSRE